MSPRSTLSADCEENTGTLCADPQTSEAGTVGEAQHTGAAASTPSTARSWAGLTRSRKPVRATRHVSIRQPGACPRADTSQALQNTGPCRKPHSAPYTGRAPDPLPRSSFPMSSQSVQSRDEKQIRKHGTKSGAHRICTGMF
jgi:hypothetical protein